MKKLLLLNLIMLACSILLTADAQTFRLATYRYSNNDRIQNLQPLARELEQVLGKKVTVDSYNSVAEFISALQTGKVDLGFINTFGYLLLKADSRSSNMNALVSWNVPAGAADIYTSVFIADSKILATWEQLAASAENLRLALVAPGSTSGNLVPRLVLGGIGIQNPENQFAELHYAGTHQAAVDWLRQGKADLAAMGSDACYNAIKNGALDTTSIKILYTSAEIQLGPALISRLLDPEDIIKIKQLLLSLHQQAPEAMESLRAGWTEARLATGFRPADPGAYDQYLNSFGNTEHAAALLRQFAQ